MRNKFRSRFEEKIKDQLEECHVSYKYEPFDLEYTQTRKYKPDFVFNNGTIIEVKGLFDAEDRRKHLDIKQQHPKADIRFVFYRDNPIYKRSKTRYSDWCDKHGLRYAIGKIPDEWIIECGGIVPEPEEDEEEEVE